MDHAESYAESPEYLGDLSAVTRGWGPRDKPHRHPQKKPE